MSNQGTSFYPENPLGNDQYYKGKPAPNQNTRMAGGGFGTPVGRKRIYRGRDGLKRFRKLISDNYGLDRKSNEFEFQFGVYRRLDAIIELLMMAELSRRNDYRHRFPDHESVSSEDLADGATARRGGRWARN